MPSKPLRAATALEYFALLVQDDAHLPVLEAAACIAHDDYPDLDVQQLLGEVDQWHDRVRRRLPAQAPQLQKVQALCRFFYGELGFGGNLNNYYDPDNSYLNAVVRTRRGIPISLALLWLELAQGVGLQAQGVAFPGHYLVKVQLPHGQAVIDPLNGQSLTREELAERVTPFQRHHALDEAAAPPLGLYLQPATARETLARMLRNLKEIHHSHRDWQRLRAVQDRLIVLCPTAWPEWRDRGLAHAECGNAALAAHDWRTYLQHMPNAPDAPAIAARLQALRAR